MGFGMNGLEELNWLRGDDGVYRSVETTAAGTCPEDYAYAALLVERFEGEPEDLYCCRFCEEAEPEDDNWVATRFNAVSAIVREVGYFPDNLPVQDDDCQIGPVNAQVVNMLLLITKVLATKRYAFQQIERGLTPARPKLTIV